LGGKKANNCLERSKSVRGKVASRRMDGNRGAEGGTEKDRRMVELGKGKREGFRQ